VLPLTLIALLVAADRIAAASAEHTIAARTERYGFTGPPDVTVEGFPFLTQLLAGRLDRVDITHGRLRLGLVTANVTAVATGITLGGRGGDVISRLTGSGLIAFPGVDRLAQAAHIPGARVSAAGPHLLKVQVHLAFITATATASVAVAGPSALRVRLISAPGIPSFLLARIRAVTIQLPLPLPLGLALSGVRVVRQGVIIAVNGRNVPLPG
jgi:hypothetical protein